MYVGVETLVEGRLDSYSLTMNDIGQGNYALFELRNKQNRITQISIRDGKAFVRCYYKNNKGETKFEGKLKDEIRFNDFGLLFFATDADGIVRFSTYKEGDGEYGQRIVKVERIADMSYEESVAYEKNKKGAAKKKAA